jgi:hypothetical protein
MSIQAADLRKLVKIVRQYEVIYGGGISSSDAAVREECESLVGLIESELGHSSGSGRGGSAKARSASSLPSLVEAKKKPKGPGPARPLPARSSELASLSSSSRKAVEAPVRSDSANAPKGKKAVKEISKAKAAETGAKRPVGAAQPAKLEPKRSSAASKPKAGARKVEPALDKGRGGEEELYKDVRSRHAGAAKAALERSDRIAGKAGDSAGAESKKRFAAIHLFDAFQQSRLPKYGGFIVCVRFSEDTGYAVIEIIGYGNMQDLYPEGETLVFKSVGCKLYAIVEPPGYLLKSVEPVNRPSEQMVPYRFAELLRLTTKRFQGIFIGRKPVFMPTSFSVFKPEGDDLAILFYDIADVYTNIQDFLIMIFRDRLGVPVADSRKAAEVIARGIREFRIWIDEA